jgi:putative tryptophan/tyrosine transport system substrate-binding protein
MAAASNPVGTGLVASLARPSGNVTGVTSGEGLTGKRQELLKELVPSATRVAVLWNPDKPANKIGLEQMTATAQALRLQLQILEVREAGELEEAFAAMTRQRASALHVMHEFVFQTHRQRLADLAGQHRLPAVYGRREYVEVGGLMSYSVDFRDNFRRAATYVDKILKGAKPADLPVEYPMKFDLVINLKTAQALGLTIPPTLLFQATEVIR